MKEVIKVVLKGAPATAVFSCCVALLLYVMYYGIHNYPSVTLGIYVFGVLMVVCFFTGKLKESKERMDEENAKWKAEKEKALKPKGKVWDSYE